MNTKRSRLFTNKAMAEQCAKNRGCSYYKLGKNSKGSDVYYVGNYEDAMKAKGNYKDNPK